MANAYPNLLDIAKANGSDQLVGLVDECLSVHPELELGAAHTIRGLQYKTLVRTTLPTVGFRAANAGVEASKGAYENRLVETFIFDPRWICDKAVADSSEDGPEAFIAMEASGIFEASLLHMAKQFYYGVGNDTLGFPGLASFTDAAMKVDATGTTEDTATSVYAVRFGPKAVQWVWGLGGKIAIPDPVEQYVFDSTGKSYNAYVQGILAYAGVQAAHKYAVGRIHKITEDNGKGLTDALIAKLLAKFPEGLEPDVLLMTKRSQEQLRASRTATNATGAPAPLPSEAFGIPIRTTAAIANTEKLAS